MQAFSLGVRSISSRSSRFAAMLDEGARAERGLEARKSERGEGVGERSKKTPARKGYENQKHPLISSASLIFRK